MSRFFDAHNHLQDSRLAKNRAEVVSRSVCEGLVLMCVNGSCQEDWEDVLSLAREFSCVVPFLGCHPWHLGELTPSWKDDLIAALSSSRAGVGEIGIDGWRRDIDDALQTRVFLEQLAVAAELGRPASIHGLKAWGRLYELMRSAQRPKPGFLLHSYGGPKEMIPQFAKIGAFFSFPGYFLRPGCEKKVEVFRHVPPERLLVETDAPDQALPEALEVVALGADDEGRRINHPANIRAVYEGLATALGQDVTVLATQVERNFQALFGTLLP